jgi:hypothetical protein
MSSYPEPGSEDYKRYDYIKRFLKAYNHLILAHRKEFPTEELHRRSTQEVYDAYKKAVRKVRRRINEGKPIEERDYHPSFSKTPWYH